MAVGILGIGIYYSAGSEATQPLPEEEIVDTIQTQYPGKVTNVNLEQDEGAPTYEAELTGENKKFALQLDASSGKVLDLKETEKLSDDAKTDDTFQAANSNDKDADKTESANQSSDQEENKQDKKEKQEDQSDDKKQSEETDSNKSKEKNDHSSNQLNDKKEEQDDTNNPVISKREAVQKALEQFSGDVDDVDLEDEDGRLYYEIEIERGDLEAEIMIDAYTGEVLIIEIDD